MAQRHPEAVARLLIKWVCMNCSATHRAHRGIKPPRSCRKCGYNRLRKKAADRRQT